MEGTAATGGRSGVTGGEPERNSVDPFQFADDIQRLMTVVPPESGSSFTALLELPATQAMELLHSPESDKAPEVLSGDVLVDQCQKPYLYSLNCSLPSNAGLVERAATFSIFASGGEESTETNSAPSNSSKVKNEPTETESNPNSLPPLISDTTVQNRNQKSVKRKNREKKVKGSSKKSKSIGNDSSENAEKLPYVHVRARRGQATDSHSLAERARREKINARMKLLQELVPGCNKISGTALVLDEIINHVQSLQRHVELLSMRLAAVNPRIDFNLDSLLLAESGSLMDSSSPSLFTPLIWPEVQVNGTRQQYQQPWQVDAYHQPVWGREDENHNFLIPENSLLSYDSSVNSVSLHSNQLKMEL